MLIFIGSVIITSIISLCFFKSKFWENRYLILLIIAGVSFIATLTTNYIIRGKLSTYTKVEWKKDIYTFYLRDTLFFKHIIDSIEVNGKNSFNQIDSSLLKCKIKSYKKTIIKTDSLIGSWDSIFPFVKNWDYYNNNSAKIFLFNQKDSIHLIPKHFVIYTYKKDTCLGYFDSDDSQGHFKNYLNNNVYIVPSENDSIAYEIAKELIYDTRFNSWLTGFSFPRIKSIRIFYIPPKEYRTIPKQFLRKIPF
ncbi:MAG: hypothetical protein PHF86_01675 [Candidatus Nanoarchaeia archaeon]|nr:hypothetical protein [Candidatus Nanoarchaeia archaeon]